MRPTLLVLLALLSGAAAARAQPWANKLFKDGTTHDFGTVPRGAQLSCRFKLTNIYAVPLEITQVRATCGCVTATPSAKVVPPRESATIDVAMDARRFTGPKTVTVHVTVGPTYVSTAELKVSGTSRADVVFNPGQINFGVVSAGQRPSQTIDVEYAGKLDWRVSEVLAKDAPFEAELKELYRRRGQVGYQVKLTLKADAPPGALKREVLLRTNDPASPLLPVLVEANVQAALRVSPDRLSFDVPKAGGPVEKRVAIRGAKPFRVLAVDGLGEEVELATKLPTPPAAVHTLTFKSRPGKAAGFKRSVKVKTDLDGASAALVLEGAASP